MRKVRALAAILLAACLVFAATPAGTASGPVHWGYEGEAGPAHWGDLSPEFAACGAGREQSPVDIPRAAPLNPGDPQFDYRPSILAIANNGHSIQVTYEAGSTLVVGNARYALVQFHLHAPSEHTLGGAYAPMELHLVHQDAGGRIAVAGVLLVEGAHNAAYEPVLVHMPAQVGEAEVIDGTTVDANALLPADRAYYRYRGSLTTPPCTEGVEWFVLAEPVELSAAQIAAFRMVYDGNNRPVQPLNGRTFLISSSLPPAALPIAGAPVMLALVIGAAGCLLAGASLRRDGRRRQGRGSHS